jgi:RNA processing factor Prp31
MADRLTYKKQVIDDLMKYSFVRRAEELKAKYRKPEPKAEPVKDEEPASEDVDLSSLDSETVNSLIGE